MKVITIGRSKENNNIIINDEKVSRNHLQIVQDDNGNFTVMDMNSTNGTFVNGKRISGQTVIRPGDEVKIGSTVLPWQSYFVARAVPTAAPVSKPMTPAPKKWWTWAAASVVLLLIGGVIWGVCLKDTKQDPKQEQELELEQKIQNSQRDYDNAAREYAEAQSAADNAAKEAAEKQAAADRAQAEADRAARKAAESKSAKDENAAAEAAKAAKAAQEAAQKAAQKAAQEAEKAKEKEKEAIQLQNQLDTLNKEINSVKKELTDAQTELQRTKTRLAESQRDSRKRLFNNTLKSIKGHEKDFCNKQGWGAGGTKKTIEDKYKAASDDEQQRIVDAIEAFANSIENSNDKKSNAESTPTPTSTPTPSTDTTKMSKE